eukprot:12845511-Alexandrium_andersonii.AAC.1
METLVAWGIREGRLLEVQLLKIDVPMTQSQTAWVTVMLPPQRDQKDLLGVNIRAATGVAYLRHCAFCGTVRKAAQAGAST